MAYPGFYNDNYRMSLREKGQAGSATTGTVGAALAAGGTIWTLRYPEAVPQPSLSNVSGKQLFVQRLSLTVTTITAFTTPVTADRRLSLFRASPNAAGTADPSGGAAYTMVRKRSDLVPAVEQLGVGRIATTGALTVTGYTVETAPLRTLLLVAAGASGGAATATWAFDGVNADPIFLLPGQLLLVAAGSTFDAAGTFQATFDVDAVEVP